MELKPIEPAMLTIPEAVAFSGLSRSRLYLLFAEGRLAPRRCGKRTLIPVSELRAYLDALPPVPFRKPTVRNAA